MLRYLSCILIIFIIIDNSRGEGEKSAHWGYRNKQRNILPTEWFKINAECLGEFQSPVDVHFATTKFDHNLKNIEIVKDLDGNSTESWNITNNGHTVVLNPINAKFSFLMKPENELFELLQMHFHWRGSEHFVDGKKFAGELHLVHQSVENKNQFAVIGFLIKLVNSDNLNMKPLVDNLADLVKYGSKTQSNLNLEDIVPMKIEHFFRYSGSLTTPGCSEVVEWNLVDSPVIGLSENQLLEFQSLQDVHGYPILTNSRPVQSKNDRVIKRSFYPFQSSRRVEFASGVADRRPANLMYLAASTFLIMKLNFF